MSAAGIVRATVLARLRGDPAVAVNRVVEGTAARGTTPFAALREVSAIDWSTKDRAGREVRVGVTVRDAGDGAARCTALAAAVEDNVAALPRDLPGWRVASVVLVRSTLLNEGEGRWAALVDFRIRLLAN